MMACGGHPGFDLAPIVIDSARPRRHPRPVPDRVRRQLGRHPAWLFWGIGVGVCSSVIPYVTDQLAMARLPRATFSLMLALLPAAATVIGLIVLAQVPTARDLAGIGLVILGVALHRAAPSREDEPATAAAVTGQAAESASDSPEVIA
jgi:drug/metabolite transporter (DMT)-like permease